MSEPEPPAPSAPSAPPRAPATAEAPSEGPTLLGQHVVSRERDLCVIKLQGSLSLAEAQAFHAGVEQLLRRYGTAYVLVDSRHAGEIAAPTRRWIAEWNRRHEVSGVAIYGDSLIVRTLLTLALQAIALLRRKPVPYVFVKTEAEARAWLTAAAQPRRHAPGTTA